jgi:hypothetical protein
MLDFRTDEGLRVFTIGALVTGTALTLLAKYGDTTHSEARETNATDHESPPPPAQSEHAPEIFGISTVVVVGALTLARVYNKIVGFSLRPQRKAADEERREFLNKNHDSLEGLIPLHHQQYRPVLMCLMTI